MGMAVDGYLFDGTIEEAFQFLRDLRPKVEEAQYSVLKINFEYALQREKSKTIGEQMISLDELWKSFSDEMERQTKAKTNTLLEELDIKNNAVLYVYDGKIVICFFLNTSEEFRKLREEYLEKSPRLRDYHYQNRSDAWHELEYHEGKMTDEEFEEAEKDWAERRDFYDNVFSDECHTPAKAGLTFQFLGDFFDIHTMRNRLYTEIVHPLKQKEEEEQN